MRINISRTKNAASYYVIETVYEGKKERTRIVEKLGTEAELKEKLGDIDLKAWAKDYVKKLNEEQKKGKEPDIIAKYSPNKTITKDEISLFNGGYLFLQSIYNDLGLDKLCSKISKKYKFKYDLNSIFSRLIYSRILFPGSKLNSFDIAKNYIEKPNFSLQNIYRALEVINKQSNEIQSTLYKNSAKICKRNTNILYYDCTNFFFEIEKEDSLRKYGVSKEHRPTPIVQVGMFMDSDAIPLAFSINPGNTNEQLTLKPLEEQILSDFSLSKFVVCTDAGLASTANRKFNNTNQRRFITTQSIKKMKKFIKDWALSPEGWKIGNDSNLFNLSELDETQCKNNVFHKERWINENGLEERLIVTFSLKYRNYQREIRNSQIQRAIKIIEKNPGKLDKINSNDCKRFITKINITKEGETASKSKLYLNTSKIEEESIYDGFYAVCTNLEGDAKEIIEINHKRWQIEDCFRIMKSEFKARPTYLSKEERIKAHFITCFVSLVIFRLLEKKLENKYTTADIIQQLSNMNFFKTKADYSFVPTYTRTDFTDDLHEKFGFRTDYEVLTQKNLKNIFKKIK